MIENTARNILFEVHEQWCEGDQAVRALFGTSVDEMALFFNFDHELLNFIGAAVEEGWNLFGYDTDTVEVTPISVTYNVRYWFMSHFKFKYRLELMIISEGVSPYHSALEQKCQQLDLTCCIAHASFKVPNEQEFAKSAVVLRNNDYELLQNCTSTYGRFSYFYNFKGIMPVIKPRVNLRDASTCEARGE